METKFAIRIANSITGNKYPFPIEINKLVGKELIEKLKNHFSLISVHDGNGKRVLDETQINENSMYYIWTIASGLKFKKMELKNQYWIKEIWFSNSSKLFPNIPNSLKSQQIRRIDEIEESKTFEIFSTMFSSSFEVVENRNQIVSNKKVYRIWMSTEDEPNLFVPRDFVPSKSISATFEEIFSISKQSFQNVEISEVRSANLIATSEQTTIIKSVIPAPIKQASMEKKTKITNQEAKSKIREMEMKYLSLTNKIDKLEIALQSVLLQQPSSTQTTTFSTTRNDSMLVPSVWFALNPIPIIIKGNQFNVIQFQKLKNGDWEHCATISNTNQNQNSQSMFQISSSFVGIHQVIYGHERHKISMQAGIPSLILRFQFGKLSSKIPIPIPSLEFKFRIVLFSDGRNCLEVESYFLPPSSKFPIPIRFLTKTKGRYHIELQFFGNQTFSTIAHSDFIDI